VRRGRGRAKVKNLRSAIGWPSPIGATRYGREAIATIIDYGYRTLGIETIRAYTDPSNASSQRVLLHCGLKSAGEIELTKPTRHGARRAPLFRITARGSCMVNELILFAGDTLP
jgi:Acetyltransferase (GNAT) domain